jgi:hypothetical protein
MPLDVYEQVASQEQDALSEARPAGERCMTARGFSHRPGQPEQGFVALQQIENDPFGLTDMARAQTYGYAQPKGSGGQGGPQIIGFVGGGLFAGALKNHGQAYTMALFGFGPGGGGRARQPGCYQQAISEVYGPLGGNPAGPGADVAGRPPGGRRPTLGWPLSAPWSRCMAQRGATAPHPAAGPAAQLAQDADHWRGGHRGCRCVLQGERTCGTHG